ncbi:MAG: Acyl carrier protein [Myxococcales bacterium]|nr:Acyl carrier protein [Myxococcales bacterium]
MSELIGDKELLRAFIAKNFYVPADQPLDERTSFLQQGIIDSTGVLELVTFVESEFGIAIEDHELLPANFDSIAAVSAFIDRKRGTGDVLRL